MECKKDYKKYVATVDIKNKTIKFVSTATGAEHTVEMRKDLKSVNLIRYDPKRNLEKETRLKKVE